MSQQAAPSGKTTRTISTLIRRAGRAGSTAGVAVLALGGLTLLGGCEVDSFLDQSMTGRWENTPSTMPIMERLAAIEGPQEGSIEYSKIRTEDLVPEVESYRLGPGDILEVTIQDLFNPGLPDRSEIDVDPRGFVDLPQCPGIFVDGKTVEGTQQAIAKALKDRQILENAIVTVNVRQRRKLTYTVLGAIDRPGQYAIGKPDLRLLEALPSAGNFPEGTANIYIIRMIPLSDEATGRSQMQPKPASPSTARPARPGSENTPGGSGTNIPAAPKEPIVDLIDELSGGNKDKPSEPAPAPKTAPAQAPASAPKPSPAMLAGNEPAVDIDDPSRAGRPGPGESNWIFVNNQWVQNARKTGQPAKPSTPGSELVTQRVIEVPVKQLLSGNAQYNVIVRPGDVIRVPSSPDGLFYAAGEVQRPGPYTLPRIGRITLQKAIVTAGGLANLAVPERVDLTRMVGPDRQATIRLNYRAIAEGTQPDIYIHPDDVINVGTNFFAFPLQVLRNGLRASYGFGFILDRNFGPDVFGAQQTSSGF